MWDGIVVDWWWIAIQHIHTVPDKLRSGATYTSSSIGIHVVVLNRSTL